MQAAQPDGNLSEGSPQQPLRFITRIWKFGYDWCVRLRVLFYVLVPMTVYIELRARHWREGFFEFLGYHFIEMVAIYLALAGIGFATRHDLEMQEQTKAGKRQLQSLKQLEESMGVQLRDLNEGVKELKRLESSLSTQRKGPFPNYLRQIGQFAKTAKYLDIIIDCLDFGSFFTPEVHKEVHEAICDAVANSSLTVRILVCGKAPEPLTGPSGQGLDKYQKGDIYLAEYCAALRKDSGFRKFVDLVGQPDDPVVKYFEDSWLKTIGVKLTPEVIEACAAVCSKERELKIEDRDTPMFKTLLQLRQLRFAHDLWLGHGIEVRSQRDLEPMFMWIKYFKQPKKERDERDDALFTFANAARGPHQLGYSTHDPDLVTTFRLIFEEKWDAAGKQTPEPWLEFLKLFGTIRTLSASAAGKTQGEIF